MNPLILMPKIQSLKIGVLAASTLAVCLCCPDDNKQTRLTILSLNLKNIEDWPKWSAAHNWRWRYNNVGQGLKTAGALPDVIALQEVPGWMWCPGTGRLADYHALHRLLASLQVGTGIRYRIAYHQVIYSEFWGGGGDASFEGFDLRDCQQAVGLALLYNPARLRNLMADTPQTEADTAYNYFTPQEGPHLRRSLPCCSPEQGEEDICSRIDGPSQNDKCGRSTPAGLAWNAGNAKGTDVALARFELRDRGSTEFHIYNLHLPTKYKGDVPDDRDHLAAVERTRKLIDTSEAKYGNSRWIPPIVTGDFNNDADPILALLPNFVSRGGPTEDTIVFVLSGKHTLDETQGQPLPYPSTATIISHETLTMPQGENACRDPSTLWSDHCGVLTTFVIQDPNVAQSNQFNAQISAFTLPPMIPFIPNSRTVTPQTATVTVKNTGTSGWKAANVRVSIKHVSGSGRDSLTMSRPTSQNVPSGSTATFNLSFGCAGPETCSVTVQMEANGVVFGNSVTKQTECKRFDSQNDDNSHRPR